MLKRYLHNFLLLSEEVGLAILWEMKTLRTLFMHLLLRSSWLLILKTSLVNVDVSIIIVDDHDLAAACKLLCLNMIIRCVWLRHHATVQVVLLVEVLSLLV